MDDDFLKFAWCSLTTGQQELVKVKYTISKNMDMPINELKEVLQDKYSFYRSDCRIKKMKVYEVSIILPE